MILSMRHAYNILVLSDQLVVIVSQREAGVHFPSGRGLAYIDLKVGCHFQMKQKTKKVKETSLCIKEISWLRKKAVAFGGHGFPRIILGSLKIVLKITILN